MSFENPTSKSEKAPIEITRELFNEISNYYGDDWEDEVKQAKLRELGITLDTGVIDIVIDGKPEKMVTDRNDFGTLVLQTQE